MASYASHDRREGPDGPFAPSQGDLLLGSSSWEDNAAYSPAATVQQHIFVRRQPRFSSEMGGRCTCPPPLGYAVCSCAAPARPAPLQPPWQ
jgi:hypothetical protein